MEIASSFYFDNKEKGIVLDNAYDLYKRSQYIKYVRENNINYLLCRDADMDLLTFFPDIKFVSLPQEAKNIEGLYALTSLTGLEISAQNLNKIDLFKFADLKYLVVYGELNENYDFINYNNLESLCLRQTDIKDLSFLKKGSNFKFLMLDYNSRLKSLNGIQNLKLNKLWLDYCLKLEDISDLSEICQLLRHLSICDCNKITDLYQILTSLHNIENLYLTNEETAKNNTLPTINFIKNFPYIKDFMTDYKIEDGDLTPLLDVENVVILKYYKHYNLKPENFIKHSL